MNKKWVILLGAVMAVSLVGLLVAGAAFAQGQTPPTPTPTAPQKGMPQSKWGFGCCGWGGSIGPIGGMDEIARLLNMTLDQIWAERVLGKTIADLAREKGVSEQQLVDALVASQKAMLDQMVTNGRLTQAQADKWLDWYKQLARLQLAEPYGPGFGFGGMRGFGRLRGFGGLHGRGYWGGGKSPTPTP